MAAQGMSPGEKKKETPTLHRKRGWGVEDVQDRDRLIPPTALQASCEIWAASNSLDSAKLDRPAGELARGGLDWLKRV